MCDQQSRGHLTYEMSRFPQCQVWGSAKWKGLGRCVRHHAGSPHSGECSDLASRLLVPLGCGSASLGSPGFILLGLFDLLNKHEPVRVPQDSPDAAHAISGGQFGEQLLVSRRDRAGETGEPSGGDLLLNRLRL